MKTFKQVQRSHVKRFIAHMAVQTVTLAAAVLTLYEVERVYKRIRLFEHRK